MNMLISPRLSTNTSASPFSPALVGGQQPVQHHEREDSAFESNLTLQLQQHRPSFSYDNQLQYQQQQAPLPQHGFYYVQDPYQYVQSPVDYATPAAFEPASIPRSYYPMAIQHPQHHERIFSNSSGDSSVHDGSISTSPQTSPVPQQSMPTPLVQTIDPASLSVPPESQPEQYPPHHLTPIFTGAQPVAIHGAVEPFSEDRSPTLTDSENASPRRVYIAPAGYYHALPEQEDCNYVGSSMPSSTSTAGTFSTHDPPTPGPGSAPADMMDFRNFSPMEASNIAYRQHHHHPQAPQTAPLPYMRRGSGGDPTGPMTPMSAHPTMLSYNNSFAHYPYGPPPAHHQPQAYVMRHHEAGSYYAESEGGEGMMLPPPSATSSVYPSSYPLSPFEGRLGFGNHEPVKRRGYTRALPPIRTARGGAVEVEGSPQISAMATARLAELAPMTEDINLDEEVKTIEAASGATAFVSKLWFLLSQPQEFGEYIRWTVKGTGFILSHNSPTFGEAILSRFFRHSNVASFVRQLNLYKMARMSQLALLEDLSESGGRVEGELTHTGFSHPFLQRGHPDLLHKIKPQSGRKKSKSFVKSNTTANENSPTLASHSPGKKNRTFAQPTPLPQS